VRMEVSLICSDLQGETRGAIFVGQFSQCGFSFFCRGRFFWTKTFRSFCHGIPNSIEGMEAEQKSKKSKRFFGTQSIENWPRPEKKLAQAGKKKTGPGRMPLAQTTQAGTGDSVGRFCRYRRSILINYDSNLLLCGTVLITLIAPTNNRELQKRPTI